MPQIISRAQAKAQGRTHYYTGLPCIRGHITLRHVSGLSCVECGRQRANAWRHAHRKIVAARRRIYKAQNAAKIARIDRQYRERNKAKIRQADLIQRELYPINSKRKHLPLPTRAEPKRCENCGRKPNGRGGLHLDHDHVTEKFRGWICHSCNVGLGHLGDSIAGLERTIVYLRRK